MNRRITIFDQEDFKTNHLLWWSLPLGDEIYSVQTLEAMSPEEREAVLNVGEGDGVLVASGNAWSMLRERYHFGIRNEGFVDCQQLTRLSIEGGAYLKCIPAGEFPEDQVINAFMNPDFTKKVDFGWFKQKVLHTIEDAHRFLGWLEQQPDDTHFGYDVESSGMAIDRWFELSGLSICTTQYGGFISLTDIRHQVGKESQAYAELMARIGQFLENRMDHIWVYNMQYEFQVSFRMFHKDLYNLCDAGVVNILDGFHLNKKFSLKWTAQRVLGCEVWDSAFDRISELIEEMLFTEIGKTKAERQKILKVDQTNFKNSPEWAKLVSMYPSYEKEFEQLILEYWGNAFMCVPSEILGYYCNLDAFYTLMIYMARKDSYAQKTFNVFMDNLRLACRLHSTGIPKDEKYRLQYESFNEDMMTIGITNCARARCWIKMEKHKAKMANINKYSLICRQLLESNKFFNGDPIAITKDLLVSNLDCFDCTETGLDEGKLSLMYGDSMAGDIVQIVKDAMVEVKMKTKIDETIVRKKKIIGIIAEKLIPLFGLDKVKIGPKHIELEKYLYYERAYKELTKVAQKQLGDPGNIPKEIYAFGSKKTRSEYCEHVSDNYFKCASPIENDEIILEMAQLFPGEASFLASLRDSTQQLPENTDFYKNLGIGSIEEAYDHFQKNFTDVWNGKPCEQTDYGIQKIFELAYKYVKDLKCDPIKETLSSFDGYQTIENFFPKVRDRYTEFEKPFDPSDLGNRFGFLLKYMLNYLLYKKNAKILSTYIQGMFKKEEKFVIEDPKTHIIIREADPDDPKGVYKLLIHFACMEKSSKRWSSGFHTIVSKSDIKSTLIAYGYGSGYGYETIGKPQQGELLSYFDISSAEVKSAGFASGDPTMIGHFINGTDIYIHTAKQFLGNDGWEKLDKAHKKMWRKRFKTIFLGLLYGMQEALLAEKLSVDVPTAKKLRESVLSEYPKLREYVESQQAYPFDESRNSAPKMGCWGPGTINTFFGDRLYLREWDYMKKAKDDRERNRLKAKVQRLAVNLVIQGGTSTAMSSGFYNDIREAVHQNWALTSLLTVHDSNTSSFPASKLWEVRSHFDECFTNFCYEMTGIKLLFDVLIGFSYQDACEAKQISDDVVELTGNARSHLMILEQLDHCDGLKYEIDMPRDQIVPKLVDNYMLRFLTEKGTSMIMDRSSYKICYKRLS